MKKHLILALLTLAFFFTPSSVLAQANEAGTTGITNPVIGDLGDDPAAASTGLTFTEYFVVLWQALITVGGLLVLIYFVWGGVEWITAGGDSGKIQKARDKITQAVIGLVVLVGSFVIIGWISTIFFGKNFNILLLQFGGQNGSSLNGANLDGRLPTYQPGRPLDTTGGKSP